MQKTETHQLYQAQKHEIASEQLYNNSGGSALLFETRIGALRKLVYRRHFDPSVDVQAAICRACGKEEKLPEHLVIHCDGLSPAQTDGATFLRALGAETVDESNSGRGTTSTVSITKARLQQ